LLALRRPMLTLLFCALDFSASIIVPVALHGVVL